MLLPCVDYVRASLPPSAVAYAYTMKDAKVHLEKGLVCGTDIFLLFALVSEAWGVLSSDFLRDDECVSFLFVVVQPR